MEARHTSSIKQFSLVESTVLEQLIGKINNLQDQISSLHTPTATTFYNNAQLKQLLGIGDKLVKKYRDEGMLGFTQVGDKYWYSSSDVEHFLHHKKHYYPAFDLQSA